MENDKNDEKIQERRQLTTIEVEKKKNNKALPPHKTSSLLFQPSNEFVEQIFKVGNFLNLILTKEHSLLSPRIRSFFGTIR